MVARIRRHVLGMLGAVSMAVPVLVGVLVSACGFQPLYGPTATGTDLSEMMKRVSVASIPGRVGQRIRNELIYAATGGSEAAPSEFRLEIAIREAVHDALVTKQGQPEARIYELTAAFKLVRISDEAVLLEGTSFARAAFDNPLSTFADIRARRDAENRAARTIASDISTRIAAILSRAA